jgi:lipopolysaccharide transport system permease protein
VEKRIKSALEDVIGAALAWRVWLLLGWQDIKLRYRRSQLGPLWITISTSVMVIMMGFLYGHLFKVNLKEYYPFLTIGMVSWTFISSMILESNDCFVEAQGYIRQLKLPFGVYLLRVLTRNLIIFAHNLVPIIVILLLFRVEVSFFQVIQLIFGLCLVLITVFGYGTVLAILGARFRDLRPILTSLIQVAFFLTPIMWQPTMLNGRYKLAYDLNPFYQLISLIRQPLTGHNLGFYPVIYSLLMAIGGLILLVLLMARTRHRIAYWV